MLGDHAKAKRAKCGNTWVFPRYDARLDCLVYTCCECGYQWLEAPLDRREQGLCRRATSAGGRGPSTMTTD